ncbi:MAG TPA: alpha/beta fold hydrolase [Aromatoleum sp.]|uniref:esterase/lipase family protein n=1 Tax=Aromatoleum sp. TaxID=2307007 RepID=UPI002B47C15F|nr:alpha/beta fold hydrolase [Aromatoleum sp.]HJV27986.1 alpha/beta fold hydrolase [Aromatoleum sp.]
MNARPESVVLVHGLWMHGLVLTPLRRRLAAAGFDAHTWSYPSVTRRLATNAQAFAGYLAGIDAETVHLVGHSLGGLIILCALQRRPDPRVRRIVLMGSPYSGSRGATDLLRVPGLSLLVGPSVQDWLAGPPVPCPPGVDIGVIAGTHALGLVGTLVRLESPNDGIVTVAETFCPAACDAVTVHANHSGMLFSRPCADQVVNFLRTGAFAREVPTAQDFRPTERT